MKCPMTSPRERVVVATHDARRAAIGAALLAATFVASVPAMSPDPQASGAARGAPTLAAGWWDRTAPPQGRSLPTSRFYVLRSDLPLAQTREFAELLDTMNAEYSKRLHMLELRTKPELNVYMFAKRKDYLDTLRTRFGVNGEGSGGMFFRSPAGAGLAFYVEDLPRRWLSHVIQHEGFHQVAHSRFGSDLPPWANEGLAEFFGEAVVVDHDVVIGQGSARTIDRLKAALEKDATIPFLEMITMTPAAWNARVQSGSAGLQYAQAWSMVHFLVLGDGGKYQAAFERYLKMINAGTPSERAFMDAFGVRDAAGIAEFERAWKRYATDAKPGTFATAVDRMTFLAEGVLALRKIDKMPKSLDELRTMLDEMHFSMDIQQHGRTETLRASDPRFYELPVDDQNRTAPLFVVEPAKVGRLGPKDRMIEEKFPTPPRLATSGMRPKELEVKWIRDDKTGAFTYTFDAK